MKLTAIILTFNEEAHVAACIETLRFADHTIVFDSFSSDDTVPLAQEAGAEVIQHRFENYAQQRNAALNAVAVRTDWVLFIDADERVSHLLADEVRAAIDYPDYAGFRIPRQNFIFGKLTLGAGWYPDYQLRLLRTLKARYDPERKVHEVVILDGREGTLSEPITHYNYRDRAHFAEKQRRYSEIDAEILFKQGVRPKPWHFVTRPIRHFFWRFFTLGGFRDGLHGLRLSTVMAWYELHKYRLLRQKWRLAPYITSKPAQ